MSHRDIWWVEKNSGDAPFVPEERLVIFNNWRDENIFGIRTNRSYGTRNAVTQYFYPRDVPTEQNLDDNVAPDGL